MHQPTVGGREQWEEIQLMKLNNDVVEARGY